jgi:hypothetical protein
MLLCSHDPNLRTNGGNTHDQRHGAAPSSMGSRERRRKCGEVDHHGIRKDDVALAARGASCLLSRR